MTYQISTKIELEQFITSNWNEINKYLDEEQSKVPTPIYSSVDIRESSEKFAPIDQNMYPAGFNNICTLDLDYTSTQFENAIGKVSNSIKRVAIYPESNTKNTFYLDHLAYLKKCLIDAEFDVVFLSFDNNIFEEGKDNVVLLSASKFEIEIHRAKIESGNIITNSGHVDLVLLNNDQSTQIEIEWNSISTPILPTPKIGWFKRQKTDHFYFYRDTVKKFSDKFSVDPNLLQAKFVNAENIDFSAKEGFENLAKIVDDFKTEINADQKVFVKANQGTYGMGITVVNDGQDILQMNRKARNKMDVGKNKIKFTSVIVQEGIQTILKYDDMPAEVTIYLVGGKSVGGFMRANSQKDDSGNLNARGMVFRKYCISEIRENRDHQAKEAVYSVIGRLSTLAAGHEIAKVADS